MAWTALSSTPGSLQGLYPCGDDIRLLSASPTVYASSSDNAFSSGVDIGLQLGPNSPLNFPAIANTGWIDYSSGGGGGSTRPSTGFLYPRGQG